VKKVSRHFRGFSTSVFIHEVTPRDGLQNEKKVLSVPTKIRLIEKLIECHPSSIEVASFVREDRVPAMSGAAEVCRALVTSHRASVARSDGMRFSALVPNVRGYQNFHNASQGVVDTMVCLVSSTEAHSQANVGMSMEQALEVASTIITFAKSDGYRVQAYASLAFGCPFEGKVDHEAVLNIVDVYAKLGVDKVSWCVLYCTSAYA